MQMISHSPATKTQLKCVNYAHILPQKITINLTILMPACLFSYYNINLAERLCINMTNYTKTRNLHAFV